MPRHASGQPLPDWVAWDCCEKVHDDGTPCTGAVQGDYGRCLAHLNPDELDQAIKRAKPKDSTPEASALARRCQGSSCERRRLVTHLGEEGVHQLVRAPPAALEVLLHPCGQSDPAHEPSKVPAEHPDCRH